MQNTTAFDNLFLKYLENTCSPEETETLLALIQKEEYKAHAHSLIEIQIAQKNIIRQVDFSLKSRFDDRLQQILTAPITDSPAVRASYMTPWRWVAAAACVGLILTVGAFFLSSEQATLVKTRVYKSNNTIPSVNYTRHITLPDGSAVVLHAGSHLEYPANFTGATREVKLQGEAYFDIVHQAAKPFIIHTGKVKTTVLGTAFDIKADSNQVVVSVTRGKVQVENEVKVLAVLTPDEQVHYDVPKAKMARQSIDAKSVVADWTREDMVFNGISFEEIAAVLSKRYDVKILFKNDSLKKCKIMASFSGTEKLEQVASVLSSIRNGSYEQLSDGTIELDGEGCN